MSFRVQITGRAQADLDRLGQELERRSPGAASRFADRFDEALDRLESIPLACGLAYENSSFEDEIRHLLIRFRPRKTYRALFLVREDEVVILAVRAPGERPLTPNDFDQKE